MSFVPANSNEAGPIAKRLLAVDDSFESAELIARVGTGCGYETKPVMDPRSVPQILQDWKPDVLTLDLCMPHKDGFSVLKSLQDVRFKGSLIIISGQNDWLRKAACQLAEVNGIEVTSHLQKPINLHALRDLLNTLRLVS
jgi:CheY-like chemotaxis protein